MTGTIQLIVRLEANPNMRRLVGMNMEAMSPISSLISGGTFPFAFA